MYITRIYIYIYNRNLVTPTQLWFLIAMLLSQLYHLML